MSDKLGPGRWLSDVEASAVAQTHQGASRCLVTHLTIHVQMTGRGAADNAPALLLDIGTAPRPDVLVTGDDHWPSPALPDLSVVVKDLFVADSLISGPSDANRMGGSWSAIET